MDMLAEFELSDALMEQYELQEAEEAAWEYMLSHIPADEEDAGGPFAGEDADPFFYLLAA